MLLEFHMLRLTYISKYKYIEIFDCIPTFFFLNTVVTLMLHYGTETLVMPEFDNIQASRCIII